MWGAYLIGFAGELAATKLTLDLALGAVVLQVVGQVAARQLDWAAIGAGYHIEGAGGEVALRDTQRVIRITPHAGCSSGGRRHVSEGMASYLQLLHLASPATALLAVDASDGQSQDLLLQLWVWVDLNRKAGGGWCSRSQDVSPLVKCMWLWQVSFCYIFKLCHYFEGRKYGINETLVKWIMGNHKPEYRHSVAAQLHTLEIYIAKRVNAALIRLQHSDSSQALQW